jgi:hypothetical protein
LSLCSDWSGALLRPESDHYVSLCGGTASHVSDAMLVLKAKSHDIC